MEHLLEALALLLFWRVGLSILGALAVGGIAALVFPSVGAAAVVLSLLGGIAVGLLWQANAAHKSEPQPIQDSKISKPVSFLSFALIGAVWGGLVASFTSVGWALLTLAALPFVLAPLLGALLKRRYSARQVAFVVCALVSGLLVPVAIHTAAAREASNPSIERTRSGSAGLAFISFWAKPALPALAAHVKR